MIAKWETNTIPESEISLVERASETIEKKPHDDEQAEIRRQMYERLAHASAVAEVEYHAHKKWRK